MKRIKLLSLACALVIASGSVYAQKKDTFVSKIRVSKPVGIQKPLMIDTINLKGQKYEDKNLLETVITIPNLPQLGSEIISADTANYIHLPQAINEHQLQLLGFQINADRYGKAKLKVSSPSMFDIYINGKKETSKTTVEDSLHLAKDTSKDISITPNTTLNVTIKYLSQKSNKAPEAVKISVAPLDKDSLVAYTFGDDGKRPTNILDIMTGVRLNGSSTSPNGQHILIYYRSIDQKGTHTTYAEMLDTKTNTRTYIGTLGMRWMPRSNKYFYTLKKRDRIQLITVDPESRHEQILAEDIPEGGFSFSPNEKFLIYSEKEENDDRKGDLKILGAPDDRMANYYNRYFIHKYDLATGVKERLTYGKSSTYMQDISADSRYMLFSTSTENITERPFRKSSMYKFDLETLAVDTLWTDESFAHSAAFSPDGQQVLITGAPEAFDNIGLNIKEGQIANSYDRQAYIMDLKSKTIDPITKNFDPSINSVYWHKTDKLIYLTVTDKDYERVYTYNTSKKAYSLLPLSEEVVSRFSIASAGGKASYVGSSLKNSSKAYVIDLKSHKSTLISDPTKALFEELALGKADDWSFTASDGTTIEGRYYLPPNFDENKKYPMVVYYYGGTTPTARTFDHSYSMHVFAALGYVVYTIQPSGAIGYGQEFSARHVNAWGKRTAEDIIEGTKEFVKQHSFVDGKKIGCAGASYGGFMTMYLQTQTDLFASAISHAGISSIASYWGEGYWGYSYSSGASAHSYPWNNKKMYIEQSPLFNADKIKTPLLLLHGTEDTNVPIGESIQMYTALKILGRPVEFVQVKGEDHGVAKFERRLEWSNTMYSWFAKWLKDEPEWWDTLYPKKDI